MRAAQRANPREPSLVNVPATMAVPARYCGRSNDYQLKAKCAPMVRHYKTQDFFLIIVSILVLMFDYFFIWQYEWYQVA